jgi:mannitol/fructose-specific phosphotransferase system IIA component (Ntr-type)
MSTGIGFGIAIPHARVDGIDRLYMVAARTVDALEFDAIDGQPVHLIFMLLTPTNTASDHSRILATLSKIMSYEEVRTSLQTSETAERFLDVLINGEDRYVP